MRNRGVDIKRTLSSLVLLRCQDLFSLDLSTYALVGQFLSCSQNDTSILNHNPDLLNVSFKKGKIMRKGKPLTICSYDEHVISDSHMMVDVANNDSGMIWALSLDGRMRINSSNPSCKDVTNHHHLFDGVDVACAGHIFVRAGKIIYLTNGSGHYMPTIVHLLLVIKYFDELGLFAKNLDKRGGVIGISKNCSLQEAIMLSRMIDAHK